MPSDTTLQVQAVANAIQALAGIIAHEVQVSNSNVSADLRQAAQARADAARLELEAKRLEYQSLTRTTAPTPTPNVTPSGSGGGVGSNLQGSGLSATVSLFGAQVPVWALVSLGVLVVGGVAYFWSTREQKFVARPATSQERRGGSRKAR